jgi:hypothetical protein
VDELLAEHTPLATIQTLLKAPLMPTQLLSSFIERYPDVVLNPLPDDPNENTLLNSLVSAKADKKVSKLLEAMFECCYLDIPNYQLDCEKKNKQGKTVLDLALANGIPEITSAILLYGNPKNLSIEQQNKLVETKIDVGGITREREKRALQIAQSDHKTIEKLCISTNVHIKHSLELEQELKQTQFELLQTQNAMVQMSHLVSHLYLKLGIELPNPTNVPQNPLVLLPSQQLDANLHGFFAPQNQAENNQVQPTMANNQG